MLEKKNNYNSIIAIIVTLICPPIGLCISLLALYKDFRNWRTYIICIAWSIAVFAYCYEPTASSDLVRYYDYLNLLKGKNLKQALDLGQYGKDGLYSFVIVSWLVTKLGDIRLLPAISTFSVYIIGLYVTCKIGEDEKLYYRDSKVFNYIVLILLSVSFYSIVNNVRNVWAFSLIGVAIFRDVYQKKRNLLTAIFYIFPIFIHTSAVVFIIVRLIMITPKKVKVVCSALCFLVPMFLNILSTKFAGLTSGNVVLNLMLNMINSGNNYFEHTTSSWALAVQNSGSEKFARLVYMLVALIMFCLYIYILQKKNNDDPNILNERTIQFIDFPFLTCLLTFSCSTMVMPEYWRFIAITLLFGGSIFIIANNKEINHLVNVALNLCAIIAMVLWVRNLFIYSNVGAMLTRSLIANPIVIFVLKLLGNDISVIG